VAARLRRGLTAVVDTLGLDPERRRGYLELARSSGMPAVAVLVDTDPARCRRRNRARDVPVPAPALEGQLRRMRADGVRLLPDLARPEDVLRLAPLASAFA
jgi:predicted kinase